MKSPTAVILAALLLLAAACSGESGESGESSESSESSGGDAAATAAPIAVEIEAVDANHYVLGEAAILHLAANAAAGAVKASLSAAGLVLESFPADGTLAQLGLRSGDTVSALDGLPLSALAELRARYQASIPRGGIIVTLSRGGKQRTVNYHWRSQLPTRSRLREPRWHDADKQLAAALATGIRRRDGDNFEIDALILDALAVPGNGLAKRCDARRVRGVGVGVASGPSICSALGVGPYDVLKLINGIDIDWPTKLSSALAELRGSSRFTISLVRFNEAKLLQFTVVKDLVMDAQLDQAVAAVAALDDKRHDRADTSGKSLALGVLGTHPKIRQIDDRTFEIERELVLSLIDSPNRRQLGRAVPNIRNGVRHGIRLYALRPSAALAAAGIHNGDSILEVGGIELSSDEALLRLGKALRTASSAKVLLRRRGIPLELNYRIR